MFKLKTSKGRHTVTFCKTQFGFDTLAEAFQFIKSVSEWLE